jgi:phosphoribosylformylglycinamidine synthase II/phosphoribosylformylglycinamidine synthase I
MSESQAVGAAQTFRIEVAARTGEESAAGRMIVEAAQHLGITDLSACTVDRLYFLHGNLSHADVVRLSHDLLADPVTETWTIPYPPAPAPAGEGEYLVEATPLPGVTDPAAENLLRAAHLLGVTGLERAATGQRFRLRGALSADDLRRLAAGLLTNPVVQRFEIGRPIDAPFFAYQRADATVETIALRSADDAALRRISAERRLALDLNEMRAIRAYYYEENREPTDLELEMLAQTWSEHCSHKTFKAAITYSGPPGADPYAAPAVQTIDGLLKTYIRRATEQLKKPWVYSAFVDNAGVIAFDETYDLAFKVETHNHPSALEPFGGANTGVGGVIRDVLGVSARPIANTDVLCFGPPNLPRDALQEGVLHPARVAAGVIHGVEDYGNKMGIPTVNGAVLYHQGYTANPLVFCGCLGLLPHGAHPTRPQPGDLVVVLGGHTGRDGLRGATFSSMEMDQETGAIAATAVQIGHPIHEKQVLEVVLRARDERLYNAITDCGAGGLSSAVGEMAAWLGVRVQLAEVPLKYPGLRPWEIWLSEAQERMVLAVPPDKWLRLRAICAGQEIDAVSIGEFTDDGRIHLLYGDRTVGDLSTAFLHEGMPHRQLQAAWAPIEPPADLFFPAPADLRAELLALLAHPNIRSKEPVIRRYDHEVQGGTAVKPLVGVHERGHGDAAVLVPQGAAGQHAGDQAARGVALSAGVCPAYGELDPYTMAWAALDEAMRNLVAVGADPDQVAVLDNFCWGNPNLPDRLGGLVRCARGCYDAALAYGVPFISGKDSLNNEYADAQGRRHAIPGTLLISALGIVPDVRCTTTADLKQPGDLLYIVGATSAELGGSHYALLHDLTGGVPPQPVPQALAHLRALHQAIRSGLVRACHDCSEGGLGVALAEMCIAGARGASVELRGLPGLDDGARNDIALFAESLSRFVVAVRPEDAAVFERLLGDTPHAQIGVTTDSAALRVIGRAGQVALEASLEEMEESWGGPHPLEHRSSIQRMRPSVAPNPSGGGAGAFVMRYSSGPPPDRFRWGEYLTGALALSPMPGGEEPEGPTPLPSPTVGEGPGVRPPGVRTTSPRVLVLHATGTNRDRDAALACELAGGAPEIVHVNQLLAGERRLADYQMLVVPGGFSYGDDLGAGTLWALDLREQMAQELARFIAEGRPVLGICNGFQTLVKAGLLPDAGWVSTDERPVTLTYNASGHFECRWVYLAPNPRSPCLFTAGLDEPIFCPVAHGEGRLVAHDAATRDALWGAGLVALTYAAPDGGPAAYPANPNGSDMAIAGLCNRAGNVLGLMPHPENHIFAWQHPRYHAGEMGMTGLRLFRNGVMFA